MAEDWYKDFKKSLFKEKYIQDQQHKEREKVHGRKVKKKKPTDLGKAIADSPLFRK